MLDPRTRQQRATTFEDEDVARSYVHRPPYAPEMYAFLAGLVSRRRRLVDLGCGPGKVAAALSAHFEDVTGIDPSPSMIAVARETHSNICWIQARAEDSDLGGDIDLVTAGTSIHWMDHAVLFPKLAPRTQLVAVITGDAPSAAPWQDAWRDAMTRWLKRLHGETYSETGFAADGQRYRAWLDIAGERSFPFTYRQPVEDFIACQHSRASWARTLMGPERTAEFDRELDALLRPHAADGMLSFELTSELVWGAPRTAPR